MATKPSLKAISAMKYDAATPCSDDDDAIPSSVNGVTMMAEEEDDEDDGAVAVWPVRNSVNVRT